MTNPKVSIIVPVYKAQKLLPRCIEGVLSQTFKDWELILIDDGSPDGSGDLCDSYAANNSRIRVLHKQNGGVSSARNYGLDFAKGELITFLDADDCWYPEYLGRMVSADADLVVCGFQGIEGCEFCPIDESFGKDDVSRFEDIVNVPYYLDSPWCKMFKRSIIEDNHLRFDPKLRLTEDTVFSYEYLSACSHIKILSDKLYFYDGVWGGTSSKYKLSEHELRYICTRSVGCIKNLNHTFGANISYRHKAFHLSKLDGLFSRYTDKEIHQLYQDCYGKISFDEFMSDSVISPITAAIVELTSTIQSDSSTEVIELLSNLRRFFTLSITNIKFESSKRKLFYAMIKYLPACVSSRIFKYII